LIIPEEFVLMVAEKWLVSKKSVLGAVFVSCVLGEMGFSADLVESCDVTS